MTYTPLTHEIRAGAINGRTPIVHRRELGTTITQAEGIACEEFDSWLAEHDRQTAERAWDAGWLERSKRPHLKIGECIPAPINPYRSQP